MRRLGHPCRLSFVRKALYRSPGGRLRAGEDHDLCFQCFRSLQNKQGLAEVPSHND